MRFLIDAQLPPALARWIAAQGHEADHVFDKHLESASDRTIWELAFSTGAVVVTKDEDFAERRARVVGGPQVAWLRCGNLRRPELIDWFALRFASVL